MPKLKKQTEPLAARVTKCLRARELGRRQYAKADRLLDSVAAEMKPGDEVEIGAGGKKAILVDEFAEKTVVFRPSGFRRYSLKVVDPT
jgi:hypothetical protein